MRRILATLLTAVCVLFSAVGPTFAQSADPWLFAPPPGATRSNSGGGVVIYKLGETQFILIPPMEMSNPKLDVESEAFIKKMFPEGNFEIVSRKDSPDGKFRLTAAVVNNKGFFFFFEKNGTKMGVITHVSSEAGLKRDNMDRLIAARLPGPNGVATPFAQSAPASNVAPSPQIQNSNWPSGGLTPSTRAEINWQEAHNMGLNPADNILPVTFDCFQSSSARSTSPNADGVLKINTGGTYSYSSDKVRGSGSYNQDPNRDYAAFQFTGVLRGTGHRSATVLERSDHGQQFEIFERNTDEDVKERKLLCYQQGPAAEAARIGMSRGLLGTETMQCQMKNGSVQTVNFSAGGYSSSAGSGRYTPYLTASGQTNWQGGFEFKSGPFNNALGYLTEDGQGNRVMDVAIHTTTRAYLTTVNDKYPVAMCFGKAKAKPIPVYGTMGVPATGASGGIVGTFTSPGTEMSGTILRQTLDVFTFTANGWQYQGTPEQRPIDCTKAKPSGEPTCVRYELSGGRIRIQERPGTWADSDWEPIQRRGASFTIGDREFTPITPMTGVKLNGTYKMLSSFSSGTITGVLATSISEGTIIFTADGRFKSSSSTWSRIGIGVGTAAMPSAITGSSNSFDANNSEGRYRIEGNWIIFTRADRAEGRQFIYTSRGNLKPGVSPELVYIDGSYYFHE